MLFLLVDFVLCKIVGTHEFVLICVPDFIKIRKNCRSTTAIKVFELRNSLKLKVAGFNPPKPVTSFAHFGFDEALMSVIRKSEYENPTPIQAQVDMRVADSFT